MKLFSCDCSARLEALTQRCDRLESSRKAQAQDFVELQDKVYRWMKRQDQRTRSEASAAAGEDGDAGARGPMQGPNGLAPRSAVEARIWQRRHRRGNGVPAGIPGEG
jgi:hypothetical protein